MMFDLIRRAWARVVQWLKPKPHVAIALAEPTAQVIPIERARKRQRTNRQRTGEMTFSQFLDGIGETFDSMRLPAWAQSHIARDTMIALRKIGTYLIWCIPQPEGWHNGMTEAEYEAFIPNARIDITKGLPSLMCISIPNYGTAEVNRMSDGDYNCLTVLAAVKVRKPPWWVEKSSEPCTYYEFSEGCELNWPKEDSKGKIVVWVASHVAVNNETGRIQFMRQLREERVNISPRGRGRGCYTRRVMDEAPLATLKRNDTATKADSHASTLFWFHALHAAWVDRRNHWSVSVRRGSDRVTFSIPKEDVPRYFANRNKSAKARDGRAKKIIHYVEAHERVTAKGTQHVRAHLRGLDAFEWGGYALKIRAPEFDPLVTVACEVSTIWSDEDEAGPTFKPQEMISGSKAALTLARLEDGPRRKLGRNRVSA